MMVTAVVTGSLAVTGKPNIFAMTLSSSSIAPQLGRTSYRASSRPVLIVRTLQLRMRFATLSPRRLANSNFGWPNISNSELRNLAVCSATYGSTNGNGRPGSDIRKPGDGYNSEFLTEDRALLSKKESPYSQDDPQIVKPSETSAKRKGKTLGPRSGDALQKSPSEKQGDDPYRILENGQKVYLDELDVITLLEPPPFLLPLQPLFYNHAVFLWKKIGDIPEERRHRLLDLLLPRHITKMWELSKLRYEDPDGCAETAADMLPGPHVPDQGKPMVWDGRIIQGVVIWTGFIYHMWIHLRSKFPGFRSSTVFPESRLLTNGWLWVCISALVFENVQQIPKGFGQNDYVISFCFYVLPQPDLYFISLSDSVSFQVFFLGDENKVYGRVITGGKFLSIFSDRLAPLYFEVMQADYVMATEEPCDIALEYGDGHLHLRNSIPPGFAKPAKHLPPFNDKTCDYLRAVGPGVMVGQAWVEGRKLEQFPRRLFGEFVMVQRFH